mgnify:CR=1 FL=1
MKLFQTVAILNYKGNNKMSNYNVKSLKAEEFISDSEILETIKYAEENKNNKELIESILEKAKPKKTNSKNKILI